MVVAADLLDEIRELIASHAGQPTPIDGLRVSRIEAVEPDHSLTEPLLVVAAQGGKRLLLGDQVHEYRAGQLLLATAALPVTGHYVDTDPRTPMLAMGLALRPAAIAPLLLETASRRTWRTTAGPPAIIAGDAGPELLESGDPDDPILLRLGRDPGTAAACSDALPAGAGRLPSPQAYGRAWGSAAAPREGGGVVMTKRVKSSRAFASMAMGRRMRPESAMPLTAGRLRPNPAVSSFSTRMGAGSSNLMMTLSGAGSSRPGSQDGMPVSSSHVPLQSSWYAALPASAPFMARSRTMAGSLSWNISSRPLSSACTWMRSWTGIFEVRPHSSLQISIQTSRSLPLAFTRNFPVGW